MRLNQFIALSTGASRRAADNLIAAGRVTVNDQPAKLGDRIAETDTVAIDEKVLLAPDKPVTIMLNKPVGYVCSREGQGAQTIYDLLPSEYHGLKPVGRLDKDSSGLLLLTNDGKLAHELTHPSFEKEKTYEIELDKNLAEQDKKQIESGVKLEDGSSALKLSGTGRTWTVKMSEGRNRQIRRTFAGLGFVVTKLHRTKFGDYELDNLGEGKLLAVRSTK